MPDTDLSLWWELTVDMDGESFMYHSWEPPQGVREMLDGLEPDWIRLTTTAGRVVGLRAEQIYHISLLQTPIDYGLEDELEEPPASLRSRFPRWKPPHRKRKTPSPWR